MTRIVERHRRVVLRRAGILSLLGFIVGAICPQVRAQTLAPLTGIQQLAAGATHTCALLNGGTVHCWGRNADGQVGDGTTYPYRARPTPVNGLVGVTAITAGGAHTCALLSGGGVRCWGSNSYGQLGDGTTTSRLTPVAVSGLNAARAISAGNGYTCALVAGGSVRCWGLNNDGQLGDGTRRDRWTSVPVSGLTGAEAITAGGGYTCALVQGGEARCWGRNNSGQLGDGTTIDRLTPVVVNGISGASAISISGGQLWVGNHACVLVAGAVRCWGNNDSRQLGDGTDTTRLGPVTVAGISGATAISLGLSHSCATLATGEMWCWGSNGSGQLGNGRFSFPDRPTRVADLAGVSQIAAGDNYTCAVVSGGQGRCWGYNIHGQLGDGTTTTHERPVAALFVAGATAVAAGSTHACALLAGGQARCWGENSSGQVGDGTNEQREIPVTVYGLSDVAAIAAGGAFSCAIVATGEVFCWGANTYGELGDGTTLDRNVPVKVIGVGGATSIAAGGSHACAVITGGAVQCWGLNNFSQLGDGTTLSRLTPITVPGITGATAIAASDYHTCALVGGGAVRCWGANFSGQLGDGTTVDRSTPVAVLGLSAATSISLGVVRSCALDAAGVIRCWGGGTLTPTVVAGLGGVTAIAVGSDHACAIVAGGEGRCWGNNWDGQLGDGTFNPRAAPVAVLGLSGASAISAGDRFSVSLLASGGIRSWGRNDNGQLGDGTLTNFRPFAAPVTAIPASAPGMPFIGVATAGDSQATVTFAAPVSNGGAAITGYTVTSIPGGVVGTGTGSPITVTGLTNGVTYKFRVTATNSAGTSDASAESNGVTPRAQQTITFPNPGAQTFGATPTLTATASSGLAVSFSSATTGVCMITSGGALISVTAGTCTINADQGGNAAFNPAPQVSRSFPVNAVVPGSPIVFMATAGDASATVTFAPPASGGGSAIIGYTVTSSPGGVTGTGSSSPITVSGLTNGVAYTFTVRATNSAGMGPASAASNSVTPAPAAEVPILRPDRVTVRDNGGELRIDVLANDSIGPSLLGLGTLSIIDAPLRGTASVLALGPAGLPGDVIAYKPTGIGTGTDMLRYRVCFGGSPPCVDSTVSIERRPVDTAGIAFIAPSDRGHRSLPMVGLPAMANARFDAHGLVAPVVVSPSLTVDSTPETPFDAGGTSTTLRTFAAPTSARSWRVFVDARSLSGGDVDVYLGLDSNANGQADSSEVACAAAMSAVSERCELVVNQAANTSVRYWVLLHSRTYAQLAEAELFEVPVDRPLSERQLVATGPGSAASGATVPVRLIWNDATLAPGQVRGGWLEVKSDANTSLGWVPVRIERSAGAAVPFALQSGLDYAMALAGSAANEGLYIDVPPGLTRLEVTTTSAANVDLYLARVDTPAASSATPTVPAAPARNLASASAVTPSGNESLTVNNPAAGRWYVTPVNATGVTADLTVRATLTGTGPALRPGGFYNPQRSGNGLFLYPAGGEWAGLWYTYLQDATPTWYYLQAPAPGATGIWRGTIYRSAWNGSSNVLTPVGEATVTPRSTSAFTFSYTLDGETGSEAYDTFGGGCPTFAGAPLNASGHWFDPARAGSGYSVQLFPNYEFYTVFGYDAQGVPRYLIAERNGIGTATQSMSLDQNTGACPLCTRTGNPVRSTVGTLTRTFGSGTLQRIQLTGTYTAGVPGTWAANDAVTPLGTLQGCAGN